MEKLIFLNGSTGSFAVCSNDVDCVKIEGALKLKDETSVFTFIVTNDGLKPGLQKVLNPDTVELRDIFVNADYDGNDIVINYEVGEIGNMVKMIYEVTTYKF
jgi:hypothetical protein